MRLPTLCLLTLAALLAPTSRAQDVYNEINVGTPPTGLYHGGEIDTVQTNNGNLHIEIPLWRVGGRGPLAEGAIFVLDTKEWTSKIKTDKSSGDQYATIQPETVGTLHGVIRDINYTHYSFTWQAANLPVCGAAYAWNRVITEANGTKHHLVPDPGSDDMNGGCPTRYSWPVYYTADGSGFAYTSAGIVKNNGIVLGSMDTNGNQLTYNPSTMDTLGRSYPTGNLTYYDNAGNPQTIQYTIVSVPVSTHLCQFVDPYPAGGCFEQTGNMGALSQIKLANGMTYTINYVQNDEAEPSSITLPSGAQISWTYGPGDQGGPIVTSRTVTANGQSNTWTYNYGATTCDPPGSCFVNSIVDPLGNETDFSYTSFWDYPGNPPQTNGYPPLHVSSKQIKDKSSGSLVLVKTETTDYSASSNTAGPGLSIRVTTTWNQTNQVTKVETDYDLFTNSSIPGYAFSASNPTARREYDWGSGAPGNLLRNTLYGYLHLSNSTYLNANILDRVTSKATYDSANNTCQGASRPCAQTLYSYDSTAITSTSGAPNHDYTGHGSTFTSRGNLTQTSRWVNPSNTWLNTTNVYDDLGNLRSTTDPANNVTSYSYTDNFTDGVNRNAQAFVTQVTHPVTNGVNHIERKQFFWYTSLVAASCGQNYPAASACTNTASIPQPDYVALTYDKMFRPLTINRGDGGTTTATYNDTALPLSLTASSSITSALSKTMTGLFDDLYRVKETQLTSDEQGTVFVDTTYDPLGRTSTVTNPHRAGSSPTDGTTTYFYDAFNRTCLLVPPDGTLPTPGTPCPSTRPTGDVLTAYSGNTTTVTDEAGKSRKSVIDGLGRLTQVFEDPAGLNYEADYAYDALDNLLSVNQKGGDPNSANWRTRTFAYDSLSRLLCAANPEIQIATCPTPDNGTYINGTVRYSYDSDGNVLTKKSPKPNQTSNSVTVTATFGYDALNRLTSKSFDNGDPTINYAYDGVVPTGWPTACSPGSFSFGSAIGKRTAMCDAAGMELWGYSITSGIGWMTTDQRTTNNVTKTATYQNNFAGSLATLTYPSTRVITYTPDGAGRMSEARDNPNSINYVTGTCLNGSDNFGVCYTPPGSPSSFLNGPSLVSTFYYNARLQPCRISTKFSGTAPSTCADTALGNVLDFTYNFNLGSSDNGNVASITNNRFPNRSQSFTYDSLNRISTAQTTATHSSDPTDCWGEAYFYDNFTTAGGGWGNLTSISSPSSAYTGCTQESLSVTALNSNRLSGFSYDAAGNLLNDGASSYVYDGENRITTGAGVTYTYDGDGKRVQKSGGKLYWYGMGSDSLEETDLQGNINNSSFFEYVFFNGKRMARRDYQNNVNYYFADHLGTARIVANSSGSVPDDSDFYPFGGERVVTSSSGNHYKFTGKERDSESGLDYFGARHNSPMLGRFMSPDPKNISKQRMADPEVWNSYAYARNNPLGYVDPNGKEATIYLLNTADYSPRQAAAIAQQLGNKIHDAGIKNVSVIVTKDKNVMKLQNEHTVVGELVHGDKGTTGTAGGAQGQHDVLGHHFVVNVDAANPAPGANGPRTAEDRETTAVANVSAHEFTHEATSNGNILGVIVNGFHDDEGLFASELHVDVNYDPNARIPIDREFDLQMQFNRENEKDNGVTVEVQPRANDD